MSTPHVKSARQLRRDELADALTDAGLNAHAAWPGTFVPPIALVGPDPDRYQYFDGAPYGRATAGLVVTLISAAGVNDAVVDEIEALIDATYRVLSGLDEFTAGDLSVGNVEGHVAASIAVTCEIDTEEQP